MVKQQAEKIPLEKNFADGLKGEAAVQEKTERNPERNLRRESFFAKRGAIGALAIGAQAVGVLSLGALAIGALAIGHLVVRRLAVGKAGFRSLDIDDLTVKRLRVSELVITNTLRMPNETSPQIKVN